MSNENNSTSLMQVSKKIEQILLDFISNPESPEIFLLQLDTTTVWPVVWTHINFEPVLNILSWKTKDISAFDEAILNAEKHEDEWYIFDKINTIDESFSEINLSPIYGAWPENVESWNEEFINMINEIIKSDKEKFKNIKKMYFYHVNSFKFVKII